MAQRDDSTTTLDYFLTIGSYTERANDHSRDPIVRDLVMSVGAVSTGVTEEDLYEIGERLGYTEELDPDTLDRHTCGDLWVIAVARSEEEYKAVYKALDEPSRGPGLPVSEMRRLADKALEEVRSARDQGGLTPTPRP
jgi:hypothetical protein